MTDEPKRPARRRSPRPVAPPPPGVGPESEPPRGTSELPPAASSAPEEKPKKRKAKSPEKSKAGQAGGKSRSGRATGVETSGRAAGKGRNARPPKRTRAAPDGGSPQSEVSPEPVAVGSVPAGAELPESAVARAVESEAAAAAAAALESPAPEGRVSEGPPTDSEIEAPAPAPEPPPRSVLTTVPGAAPPLVGIAREELLAQFERRPALEPIRPEAGKTPAPAAPGAPRRLAFVLHMHLPWVLGHGTWPHGEDWLAEAVTHCYLPLLGAFRRLADRGRRHLATVSVTPVVGAMLADRRGAAAVDRYLAERTKAAWESRKVHPLALWWHGEFERLRALWDAFDHDLVRALADLAEREAIELSTSAGAHLYLPLAHSSKTIRLALRAGRELHRELFGFDPRGCWMPECAYRPGGPWRHPVTGASEENRAGNEDFLREQGLAWTVLDSHLVRAGDPAFPYGSDLSPEEVVEPAGPHPRPYWIRQSPVAAFLRDARSAAQVWSRHGGYPGAGDFLDFHKRQWPSGLRLWRVTGAEVDLGDKLVYWPDLARERALQQAEHFVALTAGLDGMDGGVICAPFDMELFGHWWFEGPIWLERVLELTAPSERIAATTPARELEARPALRRAFFDEGSWGAGGDHRVWVNPQTDWFWHELGDLERRAFAAARWGGSRKWRRGILNQLLLAAASDWPFLVTMGTGGDYASERFREHASRLRELVELGPRARVLPSWVDADLPFPDIEPEWARPPED